MSERSFATPHGDDPLEGFVAPPKGLLRRLHHYGRRYGYLHAVVSYIGRHHRWFWRAIGPIVTAGYRERWIAGAGPHLLNLGGGGVLFDRWLTADIDPRSDTYVDLTRPLPFPSQSIDVVYCEEVIEHLERDGGSAMLRECFRILKAGGWIRITTPSLDWAAARAMNDPSAVVAINQLFYGHGHRYIYSEVAIRALLGETGFDSIRRSSYREPGARFGYFDTHPLRHPGLPPESSQYWEARKP